MSRRGKNSLGISLIMECEEEELAPEQKAYYGKNENDYKEVTNKLDHMIKSCGAELIEQASEQVYVLQMNSTGNVPPLTSVGNVNTSTVGTRLQTSNSAGGLVTVQTKLGAALTQPAAQTGIITRGSATVHQAGGTYQLIMDPKLGLVVGAMPPQVQSGQAPPTWTKAQQVQKVTLAQPKQNNLVKVAAPMPALRPNLRTPPTRALPKPLSSSTAPMVALPGKSITLLNTPLGSLPLTVDGRRGRGRPPSLPAPPPPAPKTYAPPAMAAPKSPAKPTENNAVGGLIAGSAAVKAWKPTLAPVVDLTHDGKPARSGGGNVPDSREMLFNKVSGKTFPSLVVVARPHLRVKDLPNSIVNAGRTTLDAKVKSVLMFTPTKFTEYLIQQGYVRSEQSCLTHLNPDMTAIKLKLGMYSDVSKFPYSGGYVWISECCPNRFVSVFHGSIFEGAPHPPTILLKLMYHWSAQTNVQNVVQWVKVDNFYVKNFFTNMRSICTSAVHEKYEKMGGPRKRIEVGVISLGTTSQDGNMRQVKVEVLGVMEPETKMVRLKAVEPLQDGEKNYKRRFVKILEPLAEWVYKDSIILTDFTVDKGTLHHMGFSSVYQVSVSESNAPATPANQYSNSNVMEYLRRIVPRMFQNTLSLLSRQIIQQFLDELVWRERWGPIASTCFDNILLHLSEQTKLDSHESLQTRLSKIASNPFKDWSYKSGLSQRPGQAPQGPVEPVRSGIDLLPQSIRNVDLPGFKAGGKRGGGRKRALGDVAVATPPAKKLAVPPPQAGDSQAMIDAYYLGTMAGDPGVIKKQVMWTTFIKCVFCSEQFNNNIQLMSHLAVHAQNTDVNVTTIDDPDLCRYCLATFTQTGGLAAHTSEHHQSPAPNTPYCRICEKTFADNESMLRHMRELHVATELPYECGVCTFRSSEHREVIDHFRSVHGGSEAMQCAICLKVLPGAMHSKASASSMTWFVGHLQKHFHNSTSADKCQRCKLSFVTKERALKPHVDKDHLSFKMQPGVRTYVSSAVRQMVAIPVGVSTKYTSPVGSKTQKQRLFGRLEVTNIGANDTCTECKGLFLDPGHFSNAFKCTKCRFTTSCSKAMPRHMRWFHTKAAKAVLRELDDLPQAMHCVCGFVCSAGNKLAKHMALCERKTAYASRASAVQSTRKISSASFPQLVNLDEAEVAGEDATDRWLKAFAPNRKEDADGETSKKPSAPPSMLNMLGLVRKPSIEELSLDAATDADTTQDVKPDFLDTEDVKVPYEELHLTDPAPEESLDASPIPVDAIDDATSVEHVAAHPTEPVSADSGLAAPVESASPTDIDLASTEDIGTVSPSVEDVVADAGLAEAVAEPVSTEVGDSVTVVAETALAGGVTDGDSVAEIVKDVEMVSVPDSAEIPGATEGEAMDQSNNGGGGDSGQAMDVE